uniref:Protein dispatched 1 n=1 Tax=Aceria tosichella TaxID=561515 RepID=A0A6G1S5S0_9ACAR
MHEFSPVIMGLLQSYSTLLLRHPGKVLVLGTCCVLVLFAITIYLRPLQSFDDPLIGFEARGTLISKRINTWKLLSDETNASANNISLLPNSPWFDRGYYQPHITIIPSIAQSDQIHNSTDIEPEPPIIESSIAHDNNNATSNSDMFDDDEEEYYRMVNSTRDTKRPLLVHYSLGSSKAFCGKLYEGYAQAVVSPSTSYSSHGLFNLNSMLAMCQLDSRLRLEHSRDDSHLFASNCEQYRTDETSDTHPEATTCCNSWSLPNYIACLNNKTSCFDIDVHDLKNTEHLLDICAPYYHKAPYEECFSTTNGPSSSTSHVDYLEPQARRKTLCGSIPEECLKCGGWTYDVLHFLTSESFTKHKTQTNAIEISNRLPSRFTKLSSREMGAYKLSHANIFLPLAKSSSLMKYYLALSKHSLKTPYAEVKVLNLGLKNSLFEHMISDDVKLFAIALVSILVVISIYTWSCILSLAILLIICLSLCLSYVIYELIFDIAIFPFMNLLAVVISFGICSDNAMLFCKHWSSDHTNEFKPTNGNENGSNHNSAGPVLTSREHANLDRMLKKAIKSTSAATLATACSFIISTISKVTAVRCFCIFATLSVITNYLLIVLLLPPALILDYKLKRLIERHFNDKNHRLIKLANQAQLARERVLAIGENIHQNWIFTFIIRFKFYLIITFITLMILSSVLVFHGPGLQPADDDDIQLLSKQHAFEQYDKNLKKEFAFERFKTIGPQGPNAKSLLEPPETLPVRVVFGVKPTDNGNRFDPHDRGTLVFDRNFDIAEQNTQIWLLEFCQKLLQQRFIHPPPMSEMSNCFMDTFKLWMETRSCRDPINPEIDRTPCCQTSEFPFERFTFNKCMLEIVDIMRKSPQLYSNINAGLRFFKNSTRVAALIIEYQSNRIYTDSFTKMDGFFHDIDEWVTWHINNTAPQGLRSGWFTSNNLDLLALQTELEVSTNASVWLEVLFATIALMISTQDLCLTLAGILTISTIIVAILAVLIVLKWTLGVAESILISLTIGLSIDFALHYIVAYSEGLRSRLSHGVVQRILNEVGSPIALATITTSLAGFVIVWSDILAYQELGTFLMLIAIVSWLTSTFFLLPMLATFDSVRNYGEQYARTLARRALNVLIDRV